MSLGPKARGQALTEPLYEALLQALDQPDQRRAELLVSNLHPADAADLLERLAPPQRQEVYQLLPTAQRGEVIANLSPEVQESLLSTFAPEQVAEVIAELASDDITDIVHNLADQQAAQTLLELDDYQESSPELLAYADDTAGGIMRVEYLTANPNWTVQQLIDYIRDHPNELPEYINKVFVLDEQEYLLGTITLSYMLRFPASKRLHDIMRTKPITVTPDMPQGDVARTFEKYDLGSCAVVDFKGRMLGCITVDDVLDVIIEESQDDLLRTSGVATGEDIFAPARTITQNRMPWLMVNLATAILASWVISWFDGSIEQLVALAVLMPIVASMGGNAAGQVIAVTIRALAMRQITARNAIKLLWKEMTVGTLNGLALGVVLSVGTYLFYDNIGLAMVILAATIINHIAAAVAGNVIPIWLERRGIDPALSSSIWVTTVTDVVGFFSFLGLATLLLL